MHSTCDKLGLVQIYTGPGKGKTTAAIGLAIRAAGWGLPVVIIQFMKGRDTGELHTLEKLAPQVQIIQAGTGNFLRSGENDDSLRAVVQHGLALAYAAVISGSFSLVILDEILVAVHLGLIDVADLQDLIREKPAHVELVLTGRGAPLELENMADLVTYMQEVKHPYQKGIEARQGVDY